MEVARNDSFSVSYDSQVLRRRYFQTSVEWKIICVKDRTKKDEYIFSPIFQCSNISWQLTLRFPFRTYKPVTETFVNFTNPYLVVNRVDEELSCNYTYYYYFAIIDEDGLEIFSHDSEKCLGFQESKLVTIADDKEDTDFLFEQNTLTISFSICAESSIIPVLPLRKVPPKCKVERIDAGTNTSSSAQDDGTSLSKDFEALHDNPRFADVILKVGEHEFPAHKLVLRSRSKVFEAMFEHDMQENRQDTVDLVKMDVDTVKDMLRYIYCGKVRRHLSSEDSLNLYVAADRYDLQGLVSKCRKIVLSSLSVENICEISVVADMHDDELLLKAVKLLLSKDMKEVLKTDKWKTLAKDNPILSLNLIQTAILNE